MPLGQAVLTGANPMSFGRIALYLIGVVAIIVAAYYITYYLGSKSFKQRSGRSIILRDRFAVSKDKSFFVVEAYGKIYLVGITNHSMTVIDTLSAEEAAAFQEAQKQQTAERVGLRQGMVNGMAEFIATRILKRDGVPPAGAPRDNMPRGDGDGFGSVYRKSMTKRGDESSNGAEDEE